MSKLTANELREQRERQLEDLRQTYSEFDPSVDDMDHECSVHMSANELLSIIEVFEDLLNPSE